MHEPLISNTFSPVGSPPHRPPVTFAVTYGGGCYCRSCDGQDGEQGRRVVMLEVKYNGVFDRIWLCDDCLLRIHHAAVSLEPQTELPPLPPLNTPEYWASLDARAPLTEGAE